MWKIKKSLLEDLVESSKNYYPKGFLCFLSGNEKKEEIDEFVILPNTSGADFAEINETVIPFNENILGTFHSHPNGSATPSEADKKFFQRHKINLILSVEKYGPARFGFFDRKGKTLPVQITP